jgi:hypothetical protein
VLHDGPPYLSSNKIHIGTALNKILKDIVTKYKAQSDDIISFNGLANQDDIYIGDILIVPGGVMPKKSSPIINNQVPVANKF